MVLGQSNAIAILYSIEYSIFFFFFFFFFGGGGYGESDLQLK